MALKNCTFLLVTSMSNILQIVALIETDFGNKLDIEDKTNVLSFQSLGGHFVHHVTSPSIDIYLKNNLVI